MTAEVCRVDSYGEEVKSRDLHPGETMKGLGVFLKSKIPVPVVVTALDEGKGIDVWRIDEHKQSDTSVIDHYAAAGAPYILSKGRDHLTVFRIYPH